MNKIDLGAGDKASDSTGGKSYSTYIEDLADDIVEQSSEKDKTTSLHSSFAAGPSSTNPAKKKRTAKKKEIQSAYFQAYKINNIFFNVFEIISGTASARPTEAERKELDDTLNMYLSETGFNLPPSVVLLLAYSGYVLRTLNKPEVKLSFGQRIKGFFGKFRRNKNRPKEVVKVDFGKDQQTTGVQS